MGTGRLGRFAVAIAVVPVAMLSSVSILGSVATATPSDAVGEASGAFRAGGEAGVRAPDAPTLSAQVVGSTVRFAGAATPGSTVNIYDGETLVVGVVAAADRSFVFAVNGVAAGDHSYTALATDASFNTSQESAPANVTVASIGT